MNTLRPTEYIFLKSPFWSTGGELIKTTLQELCLKNILGVEERFIIVHKRDNVKRKRYYLKLRDQDQKGNYNRAEKFILEAFKTNKELSFAQIRNYVKYHFKKDTDRFKRNYVYPDLREKGFAVLYLWPTTAAIRERKSLKEKLAALDSNADEFITNGTIGTKLQEIGFNIVLLEKETIKKIRAFNKGALDTGLLSFIEKNSFDTLNSFSSFSSFDHFDSFDSFDFADSSGFDGFGGGDFDGAGSGGDW
jgi:hypothetical protein